MRKTLIGLPGSSLTPDLYPASLEHPRVLAVADVPIPSGEGYVMDGSLAAGADGLWPRCIVGHQPVAPSGEGSEEVLSLMATASLT